jgi:hypothetical protein
LSNKNGFQKIGWETISLKNCREWALQVYDYFSNIKEKKEDRGPGTGVEIFNLGVFHMSWLIYSLYPQKINSQRVGYGMAYIRRACRLAGACTGEAVA